MTELHLYYATLFIDGELARRFHFHGPQPFGKGWYRFVQQYEIFNESESKKLGRVKDGVFVWNKKQPKIRGRIERWDDSSAKFFIERHPDLDKTMPPIELVANMQAFFDAIGYDYKARDYR